MDRSVKLGTCLIGVVGYLAAAYRICLCLPQRSFIALLEIYFIGYFLESFPKYTPAYFLEYFLQIYFLEYILRLNFLKYFLEVYQVVSRDTVCLRWTVSQAWTSQGS